MTRMLSFDLAVIGGGPAGLMAACTAAERGRTVVVLEYLPSPGRKLLASGAGKCNLTNVLEPDEMAARFACNAHRILPALRALPPSALRRWFARRHLIRFEHIGRPDAKTGSTISRFPNGRGMCWKRCWRRRSGTAFVFIPVLRCGNCCSTAGRLRASVPILWRSALRGFWLRPAGTAIRRSADAVPAMNLPGRPAMPC